MAEKKEVYTTGDGQQVWSPEEFSFAVFEFLQSDQRSRLGVTIFVCLSEVLDGFERVVSRTPE
jgi:hypothetical protein